MRIICKTKIILCVYAEYILLILSGIICISLSLCIYIHYKDNIIEINIVCICILRALYIRWDVHTYCLCVHPACNSLSLSLSIYMYIQFFMSDVCEYFGAPDGRKRTREAFKKLPGGRSSVLTEYGPEASHGDPIHGRNYGYICF